MPRPRTGEGRPLWGRAGYTALHGARLSSVPSGDQSANPASVPGRSVLQRALLSVPSAQKCRNVEQLGRPSPAGPPLQGTELAALSTPETSLERLVPLVDYSAAWKLLPNVSQWGHAHYRTRLCGALLQPFYGVTPMLVGPEQALVMEQEASTLLREETIEVVPALDKESGFYSRTSLFLGKGLRPS